MMSESTMLNQQRLRRRALPFLTGFLFSSLFAGMALAWVAVSDARNEGASPKVDQRELSLRHAHNLRVSSQVLSRLAGEAIDGRADSFEALKLEFESMEQAIAYLRESEFVTSTAEFSEVSSIWSRMRMDVDAIMDARTDVLSMYESSDRFILAALNVEIRSTDLIHAMFDNGSAASQAFIASQQVRLANRMAQRMSNIRAGTDQREAITRDALVFAKVLEGFRVGNPDFGVVGLSGGALIALNPVEAVFRELEQAREGTLEVAPKFLQARSSLEVLSGEAVVFLEQANMLVDSIYDSGSLSAS